MSRFALIFPDYGKEITPALIDAYEGLLVDLPLSDLRAGLIAAGRTCTRFPTPADIRKHTEEAQAPRLDMEAEAALIEIDRLIDQHGCEWISPERMPKGLSKLALQAIGGLKTYACRDAKSEPFMRRDFIDAYKRYSKTELLDSNGRQIQGEFADAIRGIAETKRLA